MISDWYKTSIGEVTNWYSGGTPNKSRPEYWGSDIPWISARNMKTDRVFTSDTMISKEGLNNGSRLAPADSLLLLVRGSELYNRIPICYVSKAVAFNQDVKCIICKENLSPLFLFYWLKSKELFLMKTVESTSIGAGKFDTRSFQNIAVIFPSLGEQKKIVEVFKCLDDKIELNNRMNKTLEEMAQAIFKSWFVDFEPFQDGEFVDSELGRIPRGWHVGTISDLGEVIGGSTPSKTKSDFFTTNGISWITPKDLSILKSKFISRGQVDISEEGYKNSSTKKMPSGTVLFSSRAPIGYIAIATNEVTTNQGFKSIVPKKNIGTSYIYSFLKNNLESIVSRASGSTFMEISGSVMKQIPALIPADQALISFQNQTNMILDMQKEIERQNKVLSSLRDTLLPKLMSGEIRVPIQEE